MSVDVGMSVGSNTTRVEVTRLMVMAPKTLGEAVLPRWSSHLSGLCWASLWFCCTLLCQQPGLSGLSEQSHSTNSSRSSQSDGEKTDMWSAGGGGVAWCSAVKLDRRGDPSATLRLHCAQTEAPFSILPVRVSAAFWRLYYNPNVSADGLSEKTSFEWCDFSFEVNQ